MSGSLDWSMDHRWSSWRSASLTLGSTFVINRYIGRDWMPQEDQSELGVWLELPEGSSLEATERISLEVAQKIEKIPGVIGGLPGQLGVHATASRWADHHSAGAAGSARGYRRRWDRRFARFSTRLRVCPAANHLPECAWRTRHVRADPRDAARARTCGHWWICAKRKSAQMMQQPALDRRARRT